MCLVLGVLRSYPPFRSNNNDQNLYVSRSLTLDRLPIFYSHWLQYSVDTSITSFSSASFVVVLSLSLFLLFYRILYLQFHGMLFFFFICIHYAYYISIYIFFMGGWMDGFTKLFHLKVLLYLNNCKPNC